MGSPPPTPEFQPLPDRDAWATIRGFVYQVDITLLRWLDLKDGEQLALECGEDVDRIGPALDRGDAIEHLLEQIKYRERNITLRSPEAVEAIASFHAQRDLNPGISLHFRFLSNASPGQEKPPTPLSAPSGIRLWCELRRGALPATETTTALQGIRTLLRTVLRPDGFNQQRWERFQAFLNECSIDDLLGFIGAFEWGLEAGDVNEVQGRVRERLVQSGRATPGADAQRKHAHLFVHVLRALTKSGQKMLTAADLNQSLTAEALASMDAATLQRLEEVRGFLSSRIADIERAVLNLQPKVEEGLHVSREILQASLNTQDSVRQLSEGQRHIAPQPVHDLGAALRVLARHVGVPDGVTAFGALDPVDTQPPPLVSRASRREDTIKTLLARVGEKAWCALHGSSGTGKTQLVRLVVGYMGANCRWLRLRDLNPSEATRRISTVLDSIKPRQAAETYHEWLTAVCFALGGGSLIVLDDLPNSEGHGALDELLAWICTACRHAGVRMLSMAHKPLAASTRSLVADDLHEEAVPLLLDEEIRDIFLQHDAPAQFVSPSFLKVVRNASHQHPVLVVEAARYLRADGWNWGHQALDAVLLGSYAEGLETGTVHDVRRTVRDDQARELLYRIKLIGWWFTEEQVQWVSDVSPAIALPLEKFTDLVGLWIQQDTSTRYTVSPLITSLRGINLPQERQRRVHFALAKGIMRKRRLGPEEAFQAIIHFVSAERYNDAAGILLLALNGIIQEGRASDYRGITSIWAYVPLPARIDHGMKILLRSLQAVVHLRNGKDIGYLLEDLDRLLGERKPEPEFGFVVAGAAGMLASTFANSDPVRAIRYLMHGVRALRDGEIPAPIVEGADLGERLLDLLWMIGSGINDDDQFEHWFASVQELTPEEARHWGRSPYAEKTSELVCSGIWMRSAETPTQDWPAVISRLEGVRAWALAAGLHPLAIHSLRGQIVVTAEYQHDISGAVTLAQKGLSYMADAKAQFWVSEITARQFYYQRQMSEALRWFEQAFSAESAVESGVRVNALTVAASAAASLSSTVSLAYLQRAVTLVEAASKDELPPLLVTQVWGELGIARWSAGDQRGAYRAWKRAVEALLGVKEDSDNRRILFQVMGNFSGYFALMTQSPEAPWPYAVPETGILLKWPRAVLPLYKPGRDWLILAQMALFADGVGVYEDAVVWAARVPENAGGQLAPGIDALIQRYRLPQLLEEARLTEVVALATASAHRQNPEEFSTEGLPPEAPEMAARFREQLGRLDLVAVAIELARQWLKNPESGRALASDVAAICHRAAGRQEALPWWAAAGDAIASLTASEAGWRSLYERGAGLMDSDTHLAVVYYLAAMLRAAPKDAVQLQMAVFMWLKSMFSKTLFYFTVSPLVAEYWTWALQEYPAHFGNPRSVRSYLAEAASLPDEERLRAVLRTVTQSLAVQPATQAMKDWLFVEK
jgi:hypothetical protein